MCSDFVVFLIGKVYLTLDYNFFTFHKFVSAKLFVNPVPKVINLTMVTCVIKSTHLTRVTCSQRSAVNQRLRQC